MDTMATMRSLLKDYDFQNRTQYYNMVIESYINGQREQALRQFKAMPKANRLHFIEINKWNEDHVMWLYFLNNL